MNISKKACTLHVIIIVLFVCACKTLATPLWGTPTPTPEIIADCFLSFKMAAWDDLNGDGVWDESEQPLAGVEFHLQGLFAQQWGPDPSPGNGEGWFSILVWSPGNCMAQEYTISAVPPEAYEPTTPSTVTFADSLDLEAQFGFRAVSK